MAKNDDKAQSAPPYVAFRTFTNFLDWLNESGVPSRIDRSFWGHRLSGAYGTQLMAALRFFGLVDEDDRPRPEIEWMARDPAQRKSILRDLLIQRYAETLEGLDLTRATYGELQERFRSYPIEGDTLRKAIVFFLHAAQYAEIGLSPHITRKTRGAPPRKRQTVAKTRTREPRESGPALSVTSTTASGLSPALGPLLTDLARNGPAWTKEQKDAWVTTFLALLDYAYPARGGKN